MFSHLWYCHNVASLNSIFELRAFSPHSIFRLQIQIFQALCTLHPIFGYRQLHCSFMLARYMMLRTVQINGLAFSTIWKDRRIHLIAQLCTLICTDSDLNADQWIFRFIPCSLCSSKLQFGLRHISVHSLPLRHSTSANLHLLSIKASVYPSRFRFSYFIQSRTFLSPLHGNH